MTPVVSIIMGSTSDLPVMEKAAKFLDEMEIPFEMHALSAHRTPAEVEAFAKGAKGRGIKVIIAAAGMAVGVLGSSLCLGCLFWLCLSSLTGSGWGIALRRVLAAGFSPVFWYWPERSAA